MCRSKYYGGMGFRDLEAFNVALLAKQGWRLIQNQDSLAFRVLKGKYFRRHDFMDAKIHSNASYTWRSIMESRWVLREGMGWKVGNGEQIKIWGDNWLPKGHSRRVVSPPRVVEPDAKVSVFLEEDRMEWNHSLINEVFWEREVALIRAIPLKHQGGIDERFWLHTKDGHYTVRTGYMVVVHETDLCSEETSRDRYGADEIFWKRMWKSKIPERVKVFMWRVVKGVLPTCENLIKRQIRVESVCTLCTNDMETLKHCLAECHIARQIWMISPLGLRTDMDVEMNIGEWVQVTAKKLDDDGLEMFCVVAWSIWYNRNEFRFNGGKIDHVAIIEKAVGLKRECDTLKKPQRRARVGREEQRWLPPTVGTVKVNIDGAWFADQGRGSTGVVIRDSTGKFMAAKARRLEEVIDAEHAELAAVIDGLRLAKELNYNKITVEGDALKLINMINSHVAILSPIQNEVDNIKMLMHEFELCNVCFTPRSANKVAHQLTREAFVHIDVVWNDIPPQSIIPFLGADMH